MWLTDRLSPSWPPGYVTAERFERVSIIFNNQCMLHLLTSTLFYNMDHLFP